MANIRASREGVFSGQQHPSALVFTTPGPALALPSDSLSGRLQSGMTSLPKSQFPHLEEPPPRVAQMK